MYKIKYYKANSNIVNHDIRILDAIKALNTLELKVLLVVDDNKKLIGTITDGDIRRALLKSENLELKCSKVMNNKPLYVEERVSRKIYKLVLKCGFPIPLIDSKNGKVKSLCNVQAIEDKIMPNTIVIMAGGKGERLLPLTKNTAKPMLPIREKPLIHEIVDNIKLYGFKNIVISVNYLAKQLIDYFGDGSKFDVNIEYLIEKKPLGTAGSLSLLKSNLDDPIIVINGDVLTNLNLLKLLDFHQSKKMLITMCVANYSVSIPYGTISTKGFKISKITEKPTENYLVNAGIYVVNKSVINKIKKNSVLNMTDLVEKHLKKNQVNAYPMFEDWTDIGSMHDYLKIKSKEIK